jgi:anti-anti-sigma factor
VKTTALDHGIVVIAPQGHLSANDETDALERELKQAFDQGTKRIVIDCSEVKQVNSVAFGVLISAHSHAVRVGGQFALANINRRIEGNLVITKLVLVFDVYLTVEQAVAALTQPQPEA